MTHAIPAPMPVTAGPVISPLRNEASACNGSYNGVILGVLIFVSCALQVRHSPAASLNTAERVKALALSNAVVLGRSKLQTGEIILRSVIKFENGSNAGTRRTESVHIWFDEDRVRGDYQIPYGGGDNTSYRESRTEIGEELLYYTDRIESLGRPMIAKRVQLDGNIKLVHGVPNPRLIGTYPATFGNLYRRNINSLFDNPELTPFELRSDVKDGQSCDLVRFRPLVDARNLGLLVSVWFSHASDFAPISIVKEYGGVKDELKCTVQHIKGQLWFPESVVYNRYTGDQLEYSENLSVEVVQFNEAIEDDVFSFRGMGTTPGKKIYDMIDNQMLIMTESGPIPDDVIDGQVNKSLENKSFLQSWRPYFLFGNGILVLVLAVWIYLRR